MRKKKKKKKKKKKNNNNNNKKENNFNKLEKGILELERKRSASHLFCFLFLSFESVIFHLLCCSHAPSCRERLKKI